MERESMGSTSADPDDLSAFFQEPLAHCLPVLANGPGADGCGLLHSACFHNQAETGAGGHGDLAAHVHPFERVASRKLLITSSAAVWV